MSYVHYGRIGDVWKHLPLCEFLVNEKPRYYIESNSAFPIYNLTHSPERDYGIYTILNSISDSDILSKSAFYRTLSQYNENIPNINKYLGSPGLAMNILKDSAKKFIFCDIEENTLDTIRRYALELGLADRVKTYKNDSLKTLYSQFNKFSSNDFIHIDPYLAFDPNDDGKTFFDLFLDSTKKGIKTMLWYGYENNYQKKCLYNQMKKKFASAGIKNNNDIFSIELFLSSIQENNIIVNPGVVGCGILISNLSQKSINNLDVFSDELVRIYKNSIINHRYSGELIKEKFCL